VSKGFKQEQFFDFVSKLGVKKIEIRREYIKDFSSELQAISKASKETGIQVFYSVPRTIFVNNIVDKENLNKYLEEARAMNCKDVKLNIGDYENYKGNLKEDLSPFVDLKFNITVENDQTQQNGTYKNIIKFLNDCKAQNINIGYVYDIGNWYWVDENELDNAKRLKEFTRYIHLKDVKKTEDGNLTLPLDDGDIKWREILDILPKNIEVGLEYPCKDIYVVEAGVKKLLEY
jgi:sugar phosphate isomerase/epimerase